jgi:hypothetical protein
MSVTRCCEPHTGGRDTLTKTSTGTSCVHVNACYAHITCTCCLSACAASIAGFRLGPPVDEPHKSKQDKLDRKPFCSDGSVCFYHAPVAGFNNGDQYAGNKGEHAWFGWGCGEGMM